MTGGQVAVCEGTWKQETAVYEQKGKETAAKRETGVYVL